MHAPAPDRARAAGPDLTVYYDADCGFCSDCAKVLRRLDRGRRLRLVPLQQASAEAPGGRPLSALLDTIHVRHADGRWTIGGAAWIEIADRVPLLRPLAIVARLPLAGRIVERVYRAVADDRGRISRLMGHIACRLEPDR